MRPWKSAGQIGATAAALVSTVAGTLLMPASSSAVGPRSITSDSPAQILAIALRATSDTKTFLVHCHGEIAALGVTENTNTGVGPTYGGQTLNIREGDVGGWATTHLVDRVAYFEGSSGFLQIEFNVKNSKYAFHWISVKPGQRDYGTISSGLWMRSALDQLRPIGTLSKSSVERYSGHSAIKVTGSSSSQQAPGRGRAYLYVSTRSPYLPLALKVATKLSGSSSFRGTCSLSRWSVHLAVSKPASSTPITKTNL